MSEWVDEWVGEWVGECTGERQKGLHWQPNTCAPLRWPQPCVWPRSSSLTDLASPPPRRGHTSTPSPPHPFLHPLTPAFTPPSPPQRAQPPIPTPAREEAGDYLVPVLLRVHPTLGNTDRGDVCINACVYVCMYACIYLCMYACIYVCCAHGSHSPRRCRWTWTPGSATKAATPVPRVPRRCNRCGGKRRALGPCHRPRRGHNLTNESARCVRADVNGVGDDVRGGIGKNTHTLSPLSSTTLLWQSTLIIPQFLLLHFVITSMSPLMTAAGARDPEPLPVGVVAFLAGEVGRDVHSRVLVSFPPRVSV